MVPLVGHTFTLMRLHLRGGAVRMTKTLRSTPTRRYIRHGAVTLLCLFMAVTPGPTDLRLSEEVKIQRSAV